MKLTTEIGSSRRGKGINSKRAMEKTKNDVSYIPLVVRMILDWKVIQQLRRIAKSNILIQHPKKYIIRDGRIIRIDERV